MGGPHHHPSGPLVSALVGLVLLLAAERYLVAVRRARRRNPEHGWSSWRSAAFLTGLGLLALALLPPLGPAAATDFRAHMAQHMIVGMYAPLALVLAAPVTLALRALPPASGRRLTGALRSRPAHVLAHPAAALTLSAGSLGLLYLTPLYNATMDSQVGHWLLLAHFLASGCLFAYVIGGPDPAPARPGVPTRLVYLGLAIAAHALIAQAMYGGFLVDIRAPVDQVQPGAEIMYYGGDIAELLLAAALVATWRPERRPRGAAPTAPGPARRRPLVVSGLPPAPIPGDYRERRG